MKTQFDWLVSVFSPIGRRSLKERLLSPWLTTRRRANRRGHYSLASVESVEVRYLLSATFATSLGGNGDDIPTGIALANDGGYAVVGNSNSFNGSNQDIWLSRFDANGSLLWTRTYAGSLFVQLNSDPQDPINTFSSDFATDIAPLSDGGFVITGSTRNSSSAGDGLAIRVNVVGDIVGGEIHSFAHSGVDSLNSAADNGTLVAGTMSLGIELPSATITTFGSATYFDINGVLYGGFVNDHFALNQAIRKHDGGVAAIGGYAFGNGGGFPLVATSVNGGFTGVTMAQNFGEEGLAITESAPDLSLPSQPRYLGVLTRTVSPNINIQEANIVRKLDSQTLQPIWEVGLNGTYAPANRTRAKIEALPDGGFLIAASTYYSSHAGGAGSGVNVMLTRLSADGQLVWAKAYGGPGTDGNSFNGESIDLIVTPDGYAFTVATDSFGTNGLSTSREYWVVKTDLDGNIPMMSGLVRDVTASVTLNPFGGTVLQTKSLVEFNPAQFPRRERTPEEVASGIFPPIVLGQEKFGTLAVVNNFTTTTVAVVPSFQNTPNFNSGAAQFAQANYQTTESATEYIDVIVSRTDATHGAYGKASVNYTITPNGSTSATEFLAAPAELFQYATPGFNSYHVDFEDGELTKAIRIRALDEDEFDPNDSITITLTDPDPLNDIVLGTTTSTVVALRDFSNARPTLDDLTISRAENRPVGTLVATMQGTDLNVEQSLTYSLVDGNTSNAFAINPTTGKVTVRAPLLIDYEKATSYTLTVRASDNGTPVRSDDATLTINLTNIVEAPSHPNRTFSLSENKAFGAHLGTALATVDFGLMPTYSIVSGNTGSAFAINPDTGKVTVNNPEVLNYEITKTWTLTIRATDSGNPALSGDAVWTINLTNVAEAPALEGQTIFMAENRPFGALVGTAIATVDTGRTATYSIVSGNTGSAFAINPVTGKLTVNNPAALDFELLKPWTLKIRATDNGTPALSGDAIWGIDLYNVEEAPVLPDRTISLPENRPLGAIVGTAIATVDFGRSAIYSIVGGNTGSAFAIHPDTGKVTVSNPEALNYEVRKTWKLIIRATDRDVPELLDNSVWTINLTNIVEAPVLPDRAISMPENRPSGALVGSALATVDFGRSATYSIVGGNTHSAFAINPTTGKLTVNNPDAINYEVTKTWKLYIRATDNGDPALTDSSLWTINLTNLVEAPVLTDRTISLPENRPSGALIGTALATVDFGRTATYSIVGGNTHSAFAIHPDTGKVTVNNPEALNYEITKTWKLYIRATDNGDPALTDTSLWTINLTNIVEAPVLSNQVISIPENRVSGTLVGTAVATIDSGRTATYSIVSGNTDSVFAINPTNGKVTVNMPLLLDYERTRTFFLRLRVTDSAGLTGEATWRINLIDIAGA